MLRKLNLCLNCGNDHATNKCGFKFFKPCFYCKGIHFSYLCPTEKASRDPELKISTGLISVDAATLNVESNFPTVLPTMTIPLKNGPSLHCIKDTGAQCSLILESVAERCKLKSIDTVELIINGFNASKPYATTIVEVPVCIGDIVNVMAAVCVPDININLKLEGLQKVVTKFQQSNLELADKHLLNLRDCEVISNIEMILGADYAHLLPETKPLFPDTLCACYDTPLGVVLMGSIDNILAQN